MCRRASCRIVVHVLTNGLFLGSGPNGRIRQQDVLLYLEQAPKKIQQIGTVPSPSSEGPTPSRPATSSPPAADGDYVDLPLTNIRKVILELLMSRSSRYQRKWMQFFMVTDSVFLKNSLSADCC